MSVIFAPNDSSQSALTAEQNYKLSAWQFYFNKQKVGFCSIKTWCKTEGIPATNLIVPMMPDIGLVTAEAGMSFLTVRTKSSKNRNDPICDAKDYLKRCLWGTLER